MNKENLNPPPSSFLNSISIPGPNYTAVERRIVIDSYSLCQISQMSFLGGTLSFPVCSVADMEFDNNVNVS